jgi:aryl-alcohol dehydrogenase-like predicted oxidoreductase
MIYTRLGNSGLKVARICLGTMQFGWTADETASFAVMDAYAEAGGNFIDTADIYSAWAKDNPGGVSEEIIGRWMKARGNRTLMVVATKLMGRMWPGPNGEGQSRVHIYKAVEDSLRRLQTDYIDLYQTHWGDMDTPQEETLRALDDLVKAGKVRYLGCSNEPAWRVCKALWISDKQNLNKFICLQPHYNLIHRAEFEREMEALCLDQGIGVIPYSPLAGGFLTGKYRRGVTPDSERAARLKHLFSEKYYHLVDQLEEKGKAHQASVTQMALAWILQRPVITAAIIGANTPAQLSEILGSMDVHLSQEDVTAIEAVTDWKGQD